VAPRPTSIGFFGGGRNKAAAERRAVVVDCRSSGGGDGIRPMCEGEKGIDENELRV
jgi:hypothetical protein